MEIQPINIKIKCDAMGCKNQAEYCIKFKKFIVASNMYFCKSCLKQIYESAGKILVPKSPENIIKKRIKEGKL